ncbi:hypothetical protein GGI12_005173 [Dipsacomyces acuminosporus]|nr:hypothetical protein GGI12_005173 [Dipsacomyces acuminosporus]
MKAKEQLSEYERERLENIRQNQEMLLALNLTSATDMFSAVSAASAKEPRKITNKDIRKKKTKEQASTTSPQKKTKRTKRASSPPPTRRSKRLRGESAEPITVVEEQVIETGDVSELLQPADGAFTRDILEKAIRVDGHYRGWVEEGVMARLGIRPNATEAWESEGGGKFSFKDPLGTGSKISKRSVPGGQSVAKFVSSKLLKKNPNAYFYRHTEPGVEQWTGDWTEDERQEFLTIAKKYGCGDKWGLFSTHIPHRVGYQCSNFYRQYVIPEGWIIDENYRIDTGGSAIYVGKHRRSGAS